VLCADNACPSNEHNSNNGNKKRGGSNFFFNEKDSFVNLIKLRA
jgi:hypothetical protein